MFDGCALSDGDGFFGAVGSLGVFVLWRMRWLRKLILFYIHHQIVYCMFNLFFDSFSSLI